MKTLLMILISYSAMASEYDVDMPPSPDPQSEMICIRVNNCETCTLILKEKFDNFIANKSNIKKLSKAAIKQWEKQYVFKAPVAGTIDMPTLLFKNKYLKAHEIKH